MMDLSDFIWCVIGTVMFIEGLPYAAFPGKVREWLGLILEMPNRSLRGFGIGLMVAGFFLVLWVFAARGNG